MQRYPVRTSHRANLVPAALAGILRGHFDEVAETEGSVRGRWGAVERIEVRGEKRELLVDISMNPQVPEAVARETIARYNRFLEEVTGYSSKERARRLRKSAGTDGAGS